MRANPNIFPVVVVVRGTPGRAFIGTGLERETHTIDPAHRTTIRFENSNFDIWVTNVEESEQILTLQLAHARITGMSETEVTVEGIEVKDFNMTGRTMKIILTNHGSGWTTDEDEK